MYTLAFVDAKQEAGMRAMTRVLVVAGILVLACSEENPVEPPSTAVTAAPSVVVLAAGDIAGGSATYHHEETSDLLMAEPDALVFPLGDNVYPNGEVAGYSAYYHPWWGRAKNRTRPVPGNHEYNTAGAPGYYGYFGVPAYYAKDIGPWRWYFLNSELGTSGTDANSTQAKWLKADLAANPRACVGASIHRPWLASYGGDRVAHQPSAFLRPLATILYEAGADLFLAGHQHVYERHTPTDADGVPKAGGLRQFVVGTGGAGVAPVMPTTVARTSQKIIIQTFGVLRLNLKPTGYDFRFVPIAGSTGSDAGSMECSPIRGTPSPSTSPPDLRLTVSGTRVGAETRSELRWTGANGPSVMVYRDGVFKKTEVNDGRYVNQLAYRGPVEYTYKLCDGTQGCSNTAIVTYK
jgi:hypothetical protein